MKVTKVRRVKGAQQRWPVHRAALMKRLPLSFLAFSSFSLTAFVSRRSSGARGRCWADPCVAWVLLEAPPALVHPIGVDWAHVAPHTIA